MATILGRQSLSGVEIIEVDGDPATGGGTAAPTGSIALATDGSGAFIKGSAGNTNWEKLPLGGGSAINLESPVLNAEAPFLNLSHSYQTGVARPSGLTAVYIAGASSDTVNGSYVAGVGATSNPTIVTAGASTFTQHSLVQISGSENNDGIYEVESHVSNVLTIKGVGTVPTLETFTKDQLVAGTSDGAHIEFVAVSIIQFGTNGRLEFSTGSTTTASGLNFFDVPLNDGTANTNRVALWQDTEFLQGDANFTFDGVVLEVDAPAIFNESGAAVDFRVESDNRINAFLVDGSSDRVGVGSQVPANFAGTLHVDNGAVAEPVLVVQDNGTTVFSILDGGNAEFQQDVDVRGSLLAGRGIDVRTSAYTVVANDSRKVFTNEGALASVAFSLPGAVAGLEYEFIVQDSVGLSVVAAGGDTIRIAATASASGGNISTTTVGNTVRIVAINTTQWIATSVIGSWTVT